MSEREWNGFAGRYVIAKPIPVELVRRATVGDIVRRAPDGTLRIEPRDEP